eukprot:jgi/Botrbrau1/14370/Bobra.0014s0025.1
MALSLIPEDRLRSEAAEAADISRMLGEEPSQAEEDALAEALLLWFKQDFFTWVNNPPCGTCGGPTQSGSIGLPQADDLEGGANIVELHHCPACLKFTRFPRYNNPERLLHTRKGRCGEWANCFTLCCRAMGLDARYVRDWSDHVWTEYYSHAQKRWIHMDPCEAAYDKPLLYEVGWGKQLSLVVAFSKDSVTDVTKRYTRDWAAVQSRRTGFTEANLAMYCMEYTLRLRRGQHHTDVARLQQRDNEERSRLEADLQSGLPSSDHALPGRQTGVGGVAGSPWRNGLFKSGSPSWKGHSLP